MKFFERFARPRPQPALPPAEAGPCKWLPILDTDRCGGCGQCVDACPSGAIELVSSYVQFVRPDACESGGECADVCPSGVFRMGWTSFEGDTATGRWAGVEPQPPADES